MCLFLFGVWFSVVFSEVSCSNETSASKCVALHRNLKLGMIFILTGAFVCSNPISAKNLGPNLPSPFLHLFLPGDVCTLIDLYS